MKDSALISKICFTHLSVVLVGAVGEAIVVLIRFVVVMVAMTLTATPTATRVGCGRLATLVAMSGRDVGAMSLATLDAMPTRPRGNEHKKIPRHRDDIGGFSTCTCVGGYVLLGASSLAARPLSRPQFRQ